VPSGSITVEQPLPAKARSTSTKDVESFMVRRSEQAVDQPAGARLTAMIEAIAGHVAQSATGASLTTSLRSRADPLDTMLLDTKIYSS
jgi:hypothetical protein